MTAAAKIYRLFAVFSFTALMLLIMCEEAKAQPDPSQQVMKDHPVVMLQSLDKVTARTMTFEARVGSTIKFGPLYIKIQSCRKSPPIDQPESAAFLQIWEVTPKEKAKWVFSGWMFASSPALSAMDHPIYDVWVLDCLDRTKEEAAAAQESEGADSPKPTGSVEQEPEEDTESEEELEESE